MLGLRKIWGLGPLLLTAAACQKAPPEQLPARPATLSTALERSAANRRCEVCHAEIAREWRASRHRQAATNVAFARAFHDEPDEFCWRCHAPEAPSPTAPAALSEAGVACVTCHVDAHGSVHAAGSGAGTDSPHGVQRSDAFQAIASCAACHEFAFPDARRERREMMQTTLSEHARSPFANQACSSCHMPRTGSGGHRSHAFATTRDPAALATAVRVAAERLRLGARIVVAPANVGHAFPTGDLFRRLRVSAEVWDGTRVVRREQRYLARHFQHRRQADGVVRREETYDDRPGAAPEVDAGAVTLELELGPTSQHQPIHWQVTYERVQHLDGDAEDRATLTDAVSLASGELPP